jgi:hypothetical protein
LTPCRLGFVRQSLREVLALPHERADQQNGFGAQANGAADAPGFELPSATPVAVMKRVHGDARFAGGGARTGGAAPGLSAADEYRLAGAAFGGPSRLRASASARQARGAKSGAPIARDRAVAL